MCCQCVVPCSPKQNPTKSDLIALPGAIVTLELSLIPENGFVPECLFDTLGTVSFMLQWGNYLPGLHELVLHKRAGERVEGISIDAGWGERRQDLLLTVPMAKLTAVTGKPPSVGATLSLKAGIDVVIVSMDEAAGTVVVDANAPLAGTSYSCSFTVLAIHPSPPRLECTTGPCDMPLSNEQHCDHAGRYQVATFALGCFWGAELAFMRTLGVVGTRVGYTHGTTTHPTYDEVCSGTTHHREAMQVIYDTSIVSYRDLVAVALERLRSTAAPSSLDLHRLFREENDKDTKQYRHGFYFHSESQRKVAQECMDEGNKFGIELRPAVTFWKAEEWHQQYLYKGGQSARKGNKETIRCYG